jgi:lipoate-protein ligase B
MHPIAIINRGFESYEASFAAMRAYTDARTVDSEDQLWIVDSHWAWAPTRRMCWTPTASRSSRPTAAGK